MIRRIYKSVHKKLPLSLKNELTKLVYLFNIKPVVRRENLDIKEKFPGNIFKGGMIISADFELGWAWRYSKTRPFPEKMANVARENFPEIISMLDEHNVPITFATVGHLFLNSCKKGGHDWMQKIPHFDDHWRFTEGDWFDCDPYSNWEDAKHWYAPDLIKMIQNAKVNHEISTHTFSHIDFSDKNCPPQVAEDEIRASIEAMKPFNVRPESIVFPGGTYGNTDVLKKMGISIYRKNTDADLAYPYFDEKGLLVSPTSMSFGKDHNWTSKYYIKLYKKYIDKAIKSGTVAHLWFHPSLDNWTIKNVMPEVLKYASIKRDEGLLWIGTMKEISDHINKV